ncbi:hypothetical protein H6P81_001254 [Aristolochia fimbriata]|uniref:Uncharacterized protein n=1 Tax=Aristolochia fimbriata TaxID=158543 RepID=A0AAV7F9J6_ARIFI|nr:hypothetical protein H6P81_001254 [Aristolochia fimbriata]
MEEVEKMAALKRAYADIILNTAKEAAARILISERKALRYQQELSAAKEEALNTILRLKEVMDSKIAKAEKASIDQTRKAQELEAQLNEAEDIVKDLREELKKVQDELDKLKYNLIGPLKVEAVKEQKSEPELSNPDLASIIMRSKDTELFRNGCTQRIRAFEQNLLTGKLPLPGHTFIGHPCEKNEPTDKDDESAEQTRTLVPTKIDHAVNGAEILRGLRESDSEKGQVVKFFRRFSSRRKRGRCTFVKGFTTEAKPQQQKNGEQQQNIDSHVSPENTEEASEDLNVHQGTLTRNEAGKKENPGQQKVEVNVEEISVCEVNHETPDIPLEIGDRKYEKTCEATEASSQAVCDGQLKYTFRRKRRREPLSSPKDESIIEKKSTSKWRGRDKPNVPPPQDKLSLVTESSRDSRRMVQVARQLISLSEKRWW